MIKSAATIQFLDLAIHAKRTGTHVTGRVEFPLALRRKPIPIDYHSRSIDPSIPHALDPKTQLRLAAVTRYNQLMVANPEHFKAAIAARVGESIGKSKRTIQLWAERFANGGAAALADNYTAAPRKVLECTSAQGRAAVLLCAWWSLRCHNLKAIDNAAIGAALSLTGFPVGDLIAAIDCYYSWPCDRDRYPFKRLSKWVRWDIETWLYRACADADYQRAMKASRVNTGSAQLHATATEYAQPSPVPDPPMRRREAKSHRTRRAVKGLATPAPSQPATSQANPIRSTPERPTPAQAVQAARMMNALDHKQAARQLAARVDTEIPALIANDNPQTLAEAVARLDDAYRCMLIKATQGDRESVAQAIATITLWWDMMPQGVRHNIGFMVDRFAEQHPKATPSELARRRVLMLLPRLSRDRSGVQSLAAAARIPA